MKTPLTKDDGKAAERNADDEGDRNGPPKRTPDNRLVLGCAVEHVRDERVEIHSFGARLKKSFGITSPPVTSAIAAAVSWPGQIVSLHSPVTMEGEMLTRLAKSCRFTPFVRIHCSSFILNTWTGHFFQSSEKSSLTNKFVGSTFEERI